MNRAIKAVIFDMDGVIVDSEPLWRQVMIKGFAEIGIPFTEDDCRKTQGTRFKEVVEMWLDVHQVKHITAPALENRMMSLLLELIEQEGQAIPFVKDLIQHCASKHLPIGLATSSSHVLMNKVIDKLELRNSFTALVSAEHMKYGKPHPEVFLHCAEKLGISPANCLVIEDSVNGVVAAKAAQMQVVAVPDHEHQNLRQFALADFKLNNMAEALSLFKTLLP